MELPPCSYPRKTFYLAGIQRLVLRDARRSIASGVALALFGTRHSILGLGRKRATLCADRKHHDVNVVLIRPMQAQRSRWRRQQRLRTVLRPDNRMRGLTGPSFEGGTFERAVRPK